MKKGSCTSQSLRKTINLDTMASVPVASMLVPASINLEYEWVRHEYEWVRAICVTDLFICNRLLVSCTFQAFPYKNVDVCLLTTDWSIVVYLARTERQYDFNFKVNLHLLWFIWDNGICTRENLLTGSPSHCRGSLFTKTLDVLPPKKSPSSEVWV